MITHLPVMVREAVELLNLRDDGIYVDATLGLGGHAAEMLGRLGPKARFIGIDRDDNALAVAKERLNDKRAVLLKGSFSRLRELLSEAGIHEADGVLFDFGVSMMQFKDGRRGFSFNSDDPLDMRMDMSQELKAEDIVNTWPVRELERILRDYGEEWLAARVAGAIVSCREKKKITSCSELAGIVSSAYRKRGRLHPATKTFQALRIAVNDELGEIRKGLEASAGVLRQGGRLCTISYHSLEDRLVKHFMKDSEKNGLLKVITKKPLAPSYDEIRSNPSARSAKLRGAEKL